MAKLETFPLQVGVLFPYYPASQYSSLWESSTKCKRKKGRRGTGQLEATCY